MGRKDRLLTACALVFAGAMAGIAVEARNQNGDKARCPCVDPDPDRADMSPAGFVGQFGLHVCAFHVGKDDPNLQVETHHYCTKLRDGVFQCVLYDSERGNAKLLGVEYIVSDDIFQTLPAEEKKYWHSHDFEIRTGLLLLRGIQPDCEKKLVKGLMRTWGKVWHTWPDPKTELPLGPPVLMWSATREGAIKEDLIRARDNRYKIDIKEIRKQRETLLNEGK